MDQMLETLAISNIDKLLLYNIEHRYHWAGGRELDIVKYSSLSDAFYYSAKNSTENFGSGRSYTAYHWASNILS